MVQHSVRTAVMAAARENLSLSSIMVSSGLAVQVLDIAVGTGRRCDTARSVSLELPHHAA